MEGLLQYTASWNLLVFGCLSMMIWVHQWRRDPRLIGQSARQAARIVAAGCLLVLIGLTFLIGPAIAQSLSSPESIREQLSTSPVLVAPAAALVMFLCAFGVVGIARSARRGVLWFVPTFVVLTLAIGVGLAYITSEYVSFEFLKVMSQGSAEPMASATSAIVMGSVVCIGCLSLIMIGILCANHRFDQRFWIALILPVLSSAGCYIWLFPYSSQTYLFHDLFRGGSQGTGIWIGMIALTLLGYFVARMSMRLSGAIGGEQRYVLIVITSVALSIPVAWQAFVLVGNNDLVGETTTLTTREIFFRPGGETSVSEIKLVENFVIAYLFAITFSIAGGTTADQCFRRRKRARKNPQRPEVAESQRERRVRIANAGQRHLWH